MKKRILTIFSIIMIGFSMLFLTACDDRNVANSYIKPNTVQLSVEQNQSLDTSQIVLVIKYKNGQTKEIKADQLEISNIDTSRLGVQTLTVKYKKLTASLDITVIEQAEIFVQKAFSIESKLLAEHNNKKAKKPEGALTEFYNREEPLYAGSDNDFHFRIEATGLNQYGQLEQKIKRVETEIEVELKNVENSTYTLLEGQELEQMVEIDTFTATFKFTKQAENKVFKITVSALEMEDGHDETSASFSAEVNVVEGFNVYTAKELAVYNNKDNAYGWETFKELYNLENIETNAVILQADIKITKNDIPADFFWQESDNNLAEMRALTDQEVVGSLKDLYERGVYTRELENGKQFNFIGNYFSVDVSLLPKIVIEGTHDNGIFAEDGNENYITTHTALFYNQLQDSVTTTENTHINWKNLNFIGNGTKDANPLSSGAIIQSKSNYVNFNAYNTVSANFFATYFLEMGHKENENNGNFVLDYVKAYNSYNTLLYFWGAKNVIIKNSEFIGAGGPVMVVDHPENNADDGGYPSHVNVINSKLESIIGGREPWFATYPIAGAMIGELTGLDAAFDGSLGLPPTGKTIIERMEGETPLINFVVVMKPGDFDIYGQGGQSSIGGFVRVFKTEEDFEDYYENQEPTTFGLEMEGVLSQSAITNGAHYFESNGNGGYANSAVGINGDSSLFITQTPFWVGEYLNIYTSLGIGVMIELYDAE